MSIHERISISRSFGFRLPVLLICVMAFAVSAIAQSNAKIKNYPPRPQAEWYTTWPGNTDCPDLNTSTNSNLAHITTNNELRLNYTPSSSPETVTFTAAGGSKPRLLVGTAAPLSTLTTDANTSQTNFSWRSDKAIAAVIVAGQNNTARVYWMPEGAALGSVFRSPVNYGTPDGSRIKSIGFCYHEPGNVTIIKDAVTNGGASTTAFAFASTNLTSPSSFSLVDNNIPGPDRLVKTNLYAFFKFGKTITVTEGVTTGWTLSDISCTEHGGIANSTIDFGNRRAIIKLEEGESVTCTFKNTNLSPSAANVSVTGRVLNSEGRGVASAMVVITNAATGVSNVAYTNPFGYYVFDDIESGNYYLITVSHKGYRFSDSQRSFTLNDSLGLSDFVADPR